MLAIESAFEGPLTDPNFACKVFRAALDPYDLNKPDFDEEDHKVAAALIRLFQQLNNVDEQWKHGEERCG